jgi:hypothetical protein
MSMTMPGRHQIAVAIGRSNGHQRLIYNLGTDFQTVPHVGLEGHEPARRDYGLNFRSDASDEWIWIVRLSAETCRSKKQRTLRIGVAK